MWAWTTQCLPPVWLFTMGKKRNKGLFLPWHVFWLDCKWPVRRWNCVQLVRLQLVQLQVKCHFSRDTGNIQNQTQRQLWEKWQDARCYHLLWEKGPLDLPSFIYLFIYFRALVCCAKQNTWVWIKLEVHAYTIRGQYADYSDTQK